MAWDSVPSVPDLGEWHGKIFPEILRLGIDIVITAAYDLDSEGRETRPEPGDETMAGIKDDGLIAYAFFKGSCGKVRKLCEFLGITDSRKPKLGSRGQQRITIGTPWKDTITEERYDAALQEWSNS